MQIVEAGWTAYPDMYGGEYTPHLFTFYTTNGYGKQSDYTGSWNTKFKGWYQHDANFYPGMTFSPLSEIDGPQREITIQYSLLEGSWWLNVQDVWVGCYPGSLFAVTPPGEASKATTNTLADHADSVGSWGEIYDTDNIPPKPQMGSGHFASTSWGWSAYMHSLSYCTDSSGLSPIIRAVLARHRTRVSTRSTHSSPALTSCVVTIRLPKLWWPIVEM